MMKTKNIKEMPIETFELLQGCLDLIPIIEDDFVSDAEWRKMNREEQVSMIVSYFMSRDECDFKESLLRGRA